MSLTTGDVIDGKYRIIRLIGEGGMGAVYEGENVRIHRTVAIKVLHAGVAENQDAVQRFEREAQAAGRIGSEHIVEVLDLGNLPDGDRFMVMEFMDGDALSTRIQKKGKLTARETYPVARQILEALIAAHGAGIIHRDLKPDNVYLLKTRGGQADFVKLLDFGISKFSALSGESGFSMTRTGAVMGTPYYMSPEQAKGAKGMDHRADLYAVGVILYECVTGRVPFNADTFNELLFKIVLETPQPVEQVVPDSDPEFNKIIQKAMAREPGIRYQSSKEFQEALDQWASGSGVPARMGATPEPGAQPAGLAAVGAGTPVGGVAPIAAGAEPLRPGTGTPGTWEQPGGGAPKYIEAGGQREKKSNVGLIAGLAAAVFVLGGAGIAAMRMSSSHAEAPPPAAAPAPTGPSLDEVRATAAAEAQRAADVARKAAEEKLHKAEEDARAAEERAKKAEGNSKDQEEARQARDRVKALKAATATPAPKPPVGAKPPEPPPANPGSSQQSGRHIRTEL
jgi:serine/threonine-protein kinase